MDGMALDARFEHESLPQSPPRALPAILLSSVSNPRGDVGQQVALSNDEASSEWRSETTPVAKEEIDRAKTACSLSPPTHSSIEQLEHHAHASPDPIGVPDLLNKEGWLLKQRGASHKTKLATMLVGTVAQSFLWQRCFFQLERLQLLYWADGESRTSSRHVKGSDSTTGAFKIADIDEVAVQGRMLTIHFAEKHRTGLQGQERTLLCLCAPVESEAECWGAAVRAAAADLRTDLPTGWDVGAMLSGGFASVRMVAKNILPEGSVAAMQRLIDHTFICKGTKDRRGQEVPLRLQVVEVVGVQNVAAWTDYVKARARVSARAGDSTTAQELSPEVLTATVGDTLVRDMLGEHDAAANEHWLFHGSTTAAVEGIADSEFRIDLAGSHRGTMYGRGVYLAECSSKADEYAERGHDGLYSMLLCRTVLGQILVDSAKSPCAVQLVSRCRDGFDSLCGDRWSAVGTFREFVLYDSSQVYPAYIIRYRRSRLDQFLSALQAITEQTDAEMVLRLVLHSAKVAEGYPFPQLVASIPILLQLHAAWIAPTLIRCLKDKSEDRLIRCTSAAALRMLGAVTDQVVPSLIESLEDESAEVRIAAAKALGQLGTDSACAISGLRSVLNDPSEGVCLAAAFALSELGHHTNEAALVLIQHLEGDAVRKPVIIAVGSLRWRACRAVPRLVYFLDDASADTRCAAASALGSLGAYAADLGVVPALVRCLYDEHEDVRKAASKALGQFGEQGSEAASALAERLEDQSDKVREAAAKSLGQLGSQGALAVPLLHACLGDPNKDIVRAARVALDTLSPHIDALTGRVRATAR